jgi:hypothetical protein
MSQQGEELSHFYRMQGEDYPEHMKHEGHTTSQRLKDLGNPGGGTPKHKKYDTDTSPKIAGDSPQDLSGKFGNLEEQKKDKETWARISPEQTESGKAEARGR